MTNLFVGKNISVRNATCDVCKEENKKCAAWERIVVYRSHDTKFKTGFFGGFEEVVTGCKISQEKINIDICGDCAKQIGKQLQNICASNS